MLWTLIRTMVVTKYVFKENIANYPCYPFLSGALYDSILHFLYLALKFLLVYSVDPDQMPHSLASQPGLHCLLISPVWLTVNNELHQSTISIINSSNLMDQPIYLTAEIILNCQQTICTDWTNAWHPVLQLWIITK